MKKRVTRTVTNKIFQVIGFLIALSFSTYGHAQSVGCDYNSSWGRFCRMDAAKCNANKIVCNSGKVEGYVHPETPVKYVKVRLVSRVGKQKVIEVPINNTTLSDITGPRAQDIMSLPGVWNAISRDFQDGDRIFLEENGVGISADTKFAKNPADLLYKVGDYSWAERPTAGTLSQAIKSGGEPSSTDMRCSYTTAPSVITVPCGKSCVAPARCPPIASPQKTLCVGSAKCLIKGREFQVKNVHCQTNSLFSSRMGEGCPSSALDCIMDESVLAYKLDSKEYKALDHHDDGTTYRSKDGGGGSAR